MKNSVQACILDLLLGLFGIVKKSKKSILYIGGSKPQISGISCAKLLNLEVVVTDRSIDAPAKKIADRFESIDADDVAALCKLAINLNKNNGFAGAYGVADYAYRAIGYIYDELKLPYGSYALYEKMGDKSLSREIWETCGLSVPHGYTILNNASDIPGLSFPVVIKPANSYNSQAVHTVSQKRELTSALENAFEYSDTVIIEELIEGRHFNVDMVLINGEAFPGGVTERFFVDKIDHQALSGIQGSEFDEVDIIQMYNLVVRACRAIGFDYGPVTADIILNDNAIPYLLEISPHFHAISVSSVINLDKILQGWFSYLAGDYAWRGYMYTLAKGYAAYYYILSDTTGTIIDITGLNKIKTYTGLMEIDIKYGVGSKLKSSDNNKIFCGMIILKAKKYQELYDILDLLSRSVKVITSDTPS
jgi:hypothetical protein